MVAEGVRERYAPSGPAVALATAARSSSTGSGSRPAAYECATFSASAARFVGSPVPSRPSAAAPGRPQNPTSRYRGNNSLPPRGSSGRRRFVGRAEGGLPWSRTGPGCRRAEGGGRRAAGRWRPGCGVRPGGCSPARGEQSEPRRCRGREQMTPARVRRWRGHNGAAAGRLPALRIPASFRPDTSSATLPPSPGVRSMTGRRLFSSDRSCPCSAHLQTTRGKTHDRNDQATREPPRPPPGTALRLPFACLSAALRLPFAGLSPARRLPSTAPPPDVTAARPERRGTRREAPQDRPNSAVAGPSA